MKKPVVVIVECESTSLNYIRDLQRLGYEPVILEMHQMLEDFPGEKCYTLFGAKQPKTIVDGKTYAQTLKKVKALKPVLVLSGADHALELTMRLVHDLKLPGNKYKDLPTFRDKYLCQMALKKAGIRYIHSEPYKNLKQAYAFFKKCHNKIVVKPVKGVSTMGVTICSKKEEIAKAINRASLKQSVLTNATPFLQEFIDGDEFVVNTISHNGHHKVTSCYYYKKKLITKPIRTFIYELFVATSPTSKMMKPIVSYALKVLDAMNYRNGPTHCEFKVDKYGPVLIEANCRVVGASMPYYFLDKVWGHHETNLVLQSFLNSKEFIRKQPKYARPKANAVLKQLIIPRRIKVGKIKIKQALKNLESLVYIGSGIHLVKGNCILPATIDLETSPGAVFLANKNIKHLARDLKYVTNLENNHLDKLFEIK